MHFLDPNICIDVLGHHSPAIQKKLQQVQEIGISTIVYGVTLLWNCTEPHKNTGQSPRTTSTVHVLNLNLPLG